MNPYAQLAQVVRQVLRHAFRKRGHQHTLTLRSRRLDAIKQVVDLAFRLHDLNLRVDQSSRPVDHLNTPLLVIRLVRTGGCRDEDGLVDAILKLFELQRTVIACRRQAEPVIDQMVFARHLAVEHRVQLRQRHVRLVNEQQVVVWEVVKQRPRRRACRTTAKWPRVVFDARAVTRLA